MGKLIELHTLDNVQIVVDEIKEGEQIEMDGMMLYFEKRVGIGHKIAAKFIRSGEKIIKYGVPIGSAITDIQKGSNVHLHNMKSDYIPTYTLEKEFKGDIKS